MKNTESAKLIKIISIINNTYDEAKKYHFRISTTTIDGCLVWYLRVIDVISETMFLSYKLEDIDSRGIDWLMNDIKYNTKWSDKNPEF